jgi:long-chain fatty acid transport protein
MGSATLAALLLAPVGASAQGFGVFEHGACSMGMGGTGVADPCKDASAIFFNPAGLADLRVTTLGLGGTLIGPRGDFTNDVTGRVSPLEDKYQPVPAFYVSFPIGASQSFGFGVFAPYGLVTDWGEPSTFEGRYLSYKTSLKGIYAQPTYAIKFSEAFSVGAGLDISWVDVELNQRLDLSTQQVPGAPAGVTWAALGVPALTPAGGGTDFGNVQIKGDAIQYGWHVGAIVRPSPMFSIGARYLSKQKVEAEDGEFRSTFIPTGFRLPVPLGPYPAGTPVDLLLQPQFNEGGALGPQGVSTEITMPDQFIIGVAIKPTDRMRFLFDYQRVNWSVFDELVLDLEIGPTTVQEENYVDTNGYRLGAEFRVGEGTFLRGGYLWHDGAAPDETVTPLLPEGKRKEYTMGLGQVFGPIQFDFAYQYLDQADRDGRTIPELRGQLVNNGVYQFDAHLFGGTLTWRF